MHKEYWTCSHCPFLPSAPYRVSQGLSFREEDQRSPAGVLGQLLSWNLTITLPTQWITGLLKVSLPPRDTCWHHFICEVPQGTLDFIFIAKHNLFSNWKAGGSGCGPSLIKHSHNLQRIQGEQVTNMAQSELVKMLHPNWLTPSSLLCSWCFQTLAQRKSCLQFTELWVLSRTGRFGIGESMQAKTLSCTLFVL